MVVSILKSGTYTIKNRQNNNSAYLPSDDDGESLQSRPDNATDAFKWIITKLDNDNYTVKNLETKQFAYVSPPPKKESQVVAKSNSIEWKIIGTGKTDVYWIAPIDQDYFWGVSSPVSGTPIELREGNTDHVNNWTIKSTAAASSSVALSSGTYSVVNAQYSNAAHDPNSNQNQFAHAAANDYSDKFKWVVFELSNGRYTIKNKATGKYAYVRSMPGIGTQVTVNSTCTEWRIVQVTGIPGRYTIAPLDEYNYWGLSSSSSNTPLILRTASTDTANQWDISAT